MNIYNQNRTNATSAVNAIDWYRENVDDLMQLTPRNVINPEKDKLIGYSVATRNALMWIGKMFFLFYNPKNKLTLPYYDKFPLVMPIHTYSNGFLGLNFHYLSPPQRSILLENLLTLRNNQEMDETTRIRLKYGILKKTAKYKHHKPTIKRYLTQHIKGRLLPVEPENWMTSILLPVAQFENATDQTVWNESKRKIK
tara:strand:- start:3 stop:593 length:591 start_codon:yes stop_codon:yes gene_type:complete